MDGAPVRLRVSGGERAAAAAGLLVCGREPMSRESTSQDRDMGHGLYRSFCGDGSVGDLPAYGSLGEGGFGGDLTGGGARHFGEGGLNVVADGPDGDFLHGVVVGDGSLFEAVDDGDWGEAVDAGNLAVAVTEAGSVAVSGWGNGVATDMDAGFYGLVKEEGLDEGVHLFRLGRIAGLEGEASVRKEAVWVIEEVIVDGMGEVSRVRGGFAAVAAEGKGNKGQGCGCEQG